MAVLICFTGVQVTVLSEPLIMWKENWLGEYMEMAYCSTLLPLENFVWVNVLLKTRVVCKKESASLLLCYWKSMLIGVIPSVSFWTRFWHLQVDRGSFSRLWVELQIIHSVTAQRNFSLLAEVEPGICFLEYQKSKQSHRLRIVVGTRKRAWGRNPFLTDMGNLSF